MAAPTTMQWIRQATTRVYDGTGLLATHLGTWAAYRCSCGYRRIVGWLDDADGVRWVGRVLALLLAAAILRKIGIPIAAKAYGAVAGAPWVLWGAAIWWVRAAYRAGGPGWTPRRLRVPTAAPAEAEQPPADGGTEPAEERAPVAEKAPAPPSVSPTALVAAVRDVGTPHAQLKPLASHLGVTTDAVRAAAAGMGWRVRPVRMDGRSSSDGLSLDDCPSPTPPTPSPAVVGAGQTTNNDNNNAHGEGPREGIDVRRTDGGLIIYDLADRHRRRGTVGH